MKKLSRVPVTEQPLPFQLDPEPAAEVLTAFGGVPMVVQAFRSMRMPQTIREHVRIKERERGYEEATFVESFVVLNAAGGECLEDFQRLREDAGLAEMLGHAIPSPEAARKFLYGFHDEAKVQQSREQLSLGVLSVIPEESGPLRGLAESNREFIAEFGRRCADQKIATVDLDATIIESHKREAQMTYEGEPGYQPLLAVWAETDLIVADQLRDGNVPAHKDPLSTVQAAFRALPSTVKEYYYRGDTASHEHKLVEWLADPERDGGPKGFIGFAISARMSPQLKAAVKKIPEQNWEPCPGHADDIRECAEVDFMQWVPNESQNAQSVRYIALRFQKKQGELFSDGTTVKHFAVVSNIFEWKMQRLIQWHREKAGTIEHINDVLKNDLAAGVMPCGRFGANAAWLRMAVISHNVLTVLKRIGLRAEYLTARPKRLRFLFFYLPGRLVHHARGVWLRLTTTLQQLVDMRDIADALPIGP
jgi:Transposase DDE domain group 1